MTAADDRGDAQRTIVTTQGEYSIQQFRLEVVSGPNAGLEYDSQSEAIAIGTDAANQLALGDTAISRHHCEIAATDKGFQIKDLGSTNGTWIDGLRIDVAYLRHNAVITLGDTQIRFEALDEQIVERLSEESHYGGLLGASPSMRRIYALIDRIAPSESTVLLEGETGTGKTLIAEMLHNNSRRADGPFVVIDCSAIPPTLIESELFGHEKGSFTGAYASHAGAFETARGGTVFLDEIGELPLEMQPKLLRALEERVVKRIGAATTTQLDIRLVAATNRDLREEVNNGNFRSDLYYRLNIVRLRIPALRERREDIPLLVAHFYSQYADDESAPPADLVANLARQSWPGNVRELRSAVERAVLLGDPRLWEELNEPASDQGEFVGTFDPADSYRAAKERVVGRFERWFVQELIERHRGNLSKAARAARMDRNHLRDLARKHKVEILRGGS